MDVKSFGIFAIAAIASLFGQTASATLLTPVPGPAFSRVTVRAGSVGNIKTVQGFGPQTVTNDEHSTGSFNSFKSGSSETGDSATGGFASAIAQAEVDVGTAHNGTSTNSESYYSYQITAGLKEGVDLSQVNTPIDLVLPFEMIYSLGTTTHARTISGNPTSAYGVSTSSASITLGLGGSTIASESLTASFDSRTGAYTYTGSIQQNSDAFSTQGDTANYNGTLAFDMAPGSVLSVELYSHSNSWVYGGGLGFLNGQLVDDTAAGYARSTADPVLSFDQQAFDAYMGGLGLQSFALTDYFEIAYSEGTAPVADVAAPAPATLWLSFGGMVLLGLGRARRRRT